jgi:hypothetical protein
VCEEKPCTWFDVTYGGGLLPMGWPFVGGSIDEVYCPDDWWNSDTWIQTRVIGWPVLFVFTVIAFFAASCFVMPRINGRRDTTGLCGKLGSAIQDKLDEMESVRKIKRKFTSTWNGKLHLIVQHFGDESGVIGADEFLAMFRIIGDGFVDATSYADAVRAFGTVVDNTDAPTQSSVIDIAAIETIYSLGCRTWREKHVQVDRDFERFKIISDLYEQSHSDFLVMTGSLGSQGLVDVHGYTAEEELAGGLALSTNIIARANARIALAASGGAEFASAVDEEFSVESAMSEAERFTIALPSLYVETWLFVLIVAFLFLFLHDGSKHLQLKYFPEKEGAEGGAAFLEAVENAYGPGAIERSILDKIGAFASLGHKVCIFHFLFIAICILPMRLITVLAPKSICARKLAEKLEPKPFNEREFVVEDEAAPDVRTPLTRVITARNLKLCDKIKMLPLFLIRDICGIVVAVFKIVGLSLNVFVFIEPFIDFKRKSLELGKLRISGVTFSFAADPFDAYMRWLNLKLVDLMTLGLYEKIFAKKAMKAYLGFLDAQIKWNCASKDIPIGFDTSRSFVYFSARVPPWESAILNGIYLIPMLIFPWPSLFAKHRLTASWQLELSKYRFGGRQPRLGGVFVRIVLFAPCTSPHALPNLSLSPPRFASPLFQSGWRKEVLPQQRWLQRSVQAEREGTLPHKRPRPVRQKVRVST